MGALSTDAETLKELEDIKVALAAWELSRKTTLWEEVAFLKSIKGTNANLLNGITTVTFQKVADRLAEVLGVGKPNVAS